MGAEGGDGTDGSATTLLGSQGRSMVGKMKVEYVNIKISLLRMVGGEQENLKPCYTDPPPYGLWMEYTLGSRCISSLDEDSPFDGSLVYRAQFHHQGPRSPHS
jgi:hypothetical protein